MVKFEVEERIWLSPKELNVFDRIAIIMGMEREEFVKFAENRGILHILIEKLRAKEKLKEAVE